MVCGSPTDGFPYPTLQFHIDLKGSACLMAGPKKSNAPYAIGMKSSFKEAPPFRPAINIGCLMDLPTGRYIRAADGHMVHTGGLSHVTGIGGRGNTYKSTLAHYMFLLALDRFIPLADAQARDTEFSQSTERFQDLAWSMPTLSSLNLALTDHFMISAQGAGEDSGNAWFKRLSQRFDSKRDAGRQVMYTTPWLMPDKRPMLVYHPTMIEIDSLSMFTTDVVDEIFEKNQVGEGGANTVHMRSSGAKSQLVMQLPNMAASSGGYLIFTAHMGDDIQIDAYAPPAKKLAFMKNKLKFKSVPENITFLTNNLWTVTNVQVEHTKEHTVTYPKNERDNIEGDSDLQRLQVVNLRGKAGPSGMPFDLIISQREGLLPSISEYHYLKTHGRYGLGGDNTRYFLELYPSQTLMRTTIRGLCKTDAKLRRAMEITSELCQIKFMKPELADLLITPKKLRDAMDKLGYDWDKILDSRGYWVFQEMEADTPKAYLSTLDILMMASQRESHPWYRTFLKDGAELPGVIASESSIDQVMAAAAARAEAEMAQAMREADAMVDD